jgi:hypothetical protein
VPKPKRLLIEDEEERTEGEYRRRRNRLDQKEQIRRFRKVAKKLRDEY